MKRTVAFFVYTAGAMSVLGSVVWGAHGIPFGGLGDWFEAAYSIALAVGIWWITAGIGIRLDVFPIDYFRFLAAYFGLGYESPVPGATKLPRQEAEEHDAGSRL